MVKVSYETTPDRFNEGIGLLSAEQVGKILIACQDAIKEQYAVPGDKDIFSKVHDKGEYGAYRLTIQQLVDAGWLYSGTIEYINSTLSDHPEGPEKVEKRKSYFQYAKETLGKEIDFAETKIESKNSAQYYFITDKLDNAGIKKILTGSELLLSGFYQDSVAYDYLSFIYELLNTARVITPLVDERIIAGLLSTALCVNFDTARSYANGIIKKDTNGITSKYWYDIGWNSIAENPLAVSIAKPDVPIVPLIEGAATETEIVFDKLKVKYSISGQNITGIISYDNVDIAVSTPVSINSLSKQLDKVIQSTKILGPREKYDILESFKLKLIETFATDIAPLKKQLKIVEPEIVKNNDSDGNTITTTVTTDPDGTKTTVIETVNAEGTVRTKETIQEKIILETKVKETDLTDPPKNEVPNASADETVNSVNSTQTYQANNRPFNTDALPADKQDDKKGFKDPNKVYPAVESVNKPDTNPLATGVNSAGISPSPKIPAGDRESLSPGASPAAKNASRRREVKTAGRNGSTWEQPKTPYNAQYPYNKVFGSESGHAIEIDDTPGSERLNFAHRSGTFDETSPDGTKVTRIVGDGYTIIDKNGYILIDGIANIHVSGTCNVIIMSDTNLTMHGRVSMDIHNDVDVNIAGRLSLSVGEGIFARNGGVMSVENIGDIDIDTKGNLTTDVVGKFNLTSDSGVNLTSKADTHIKTVGQFFSHSTGDMNMCTDAAIKTKSAAATEIKSGASVNVEGAGNINLKAPLVASSPIDTPTLDVTTANITTLNAGSTNLTGTHNSPNDTTNIRGNTTASVTAPVTASEAVCAEPAPLSNVKVVEKPVSRSVAGNSQMIGGNSSGVGGGGSTASDDTSFDTEEESSESENCKNGVGSNDAGQSPTETGDGSPETSSSGTITAPGSGKAPTVCNLYYKTKQPMPALAMNGKISGDIKLSDNYHLRDIFKDGRTVANLIPYRRNGKTIFTSWDIVQNYRCLFLNIVEPLREKYPGFNINSGFRETDTAHGYAAVDLQWPNYQDKQTKMLEIARYVATTLPHDQILLEKQSASSRTAWLHIGYKYYTGAQRGQHFSVQSVPWKPRGPNKFTFVNLW
jgi:hypothetical protein